MCCTESKIPCVCLKIAQQITSLSSLFTCSLDSILFVFCSKCWHMGLGRESGSLIFFSLLHCWQFLLGQRTGSCGTQSIGCSALSPIHRWLVSWFMCLCLSPVTLLFLAAKHRLISELRLITSMECLICLLKKVLNYDQTFVCKCVSSLLSSVLTLSTPLGFTEEHFSL